MSDAGGAGDGGENSGSPAVLAELVARDHARLLAVLAAESRDIAAAEDALSDAYERALRTWPRAGIPSNPQAWLITVGRNRLRDRFRSAAYRTSGPLHEATGSAAEPAGGTAADRIDLEPDEIPDKRLALLFVCAHPAIDPAARTPLMLQTVLGLDARRIAVAYAVPEQAMAQRLVRAKRKIRAAGIPFTVPGREAMPARLPAVLEAVYGAYAIEWRPVSGAVDRGSLTAEALALGLLLAELMPGEPEVLGLAALLCLSAARLGASRDGEGRFVPLPEQDPGAWDADLIRRGESLLRRARTHDAIGRFQLEAAIQSAHDARLYGVEPQPGQLRRLHEALVGMHPTLGARVALAATVADDKGAAAGLAALDAIGGDAVGRFQPAWATRAHLLAELRRSDEANAAYDRAISLTTDPVLRAHLGRMRARLNDATVSQSAPAAQALSSALTVIVIELEGFEAGIRDDEPDALHQARTRVRRVRSILSVYRHVFEKDARRTLRRRLASYGHRLGAARDAEVRADALRALAGQAEHPHQRDALDELAEGAQADASRALRDALDAIDTAAHRALLAKLRTFAAGPPAGKDAAAPVADVARHSLARAVHQVKAAADRVDRFGDLDQLHTLRKAARRLRYAAEAVTSESAATEPTGADRALVALAAAAEQVQDALGDHRDGVLLAGELHAWAGRSGHPGAGRVAELADGTLVQGRLRLDELDGMLAGLWAAADAYESVGPRP